MTTKYSKGFFELLTASIGNSYSSVPDHEQKDYETSTYTATAESRRRIFLLLNVGHHSFPTTLIIALQYPSDSHTCYCYWVVRYKASHATATIFWSIVLHIWALFPIHAPEFSALVVAETPSSEPEETGLEMTAEFSLSISYHTSRHL
jgi:hypothetical protein